MPASSIALFADLSGTKSLFDAMGPERATDAVARLDDWLQGVCEAHGGRFLRLVGDGVLCAFSDASAAVAAATEAQRNHQKRILRWPANLRVRLKIGIAQGQLMDRSADVADDALSLAMRLGVLCELDQIWVTEAAMALAAAPSGCHFRSLGLLQLRPELIRKAFALEWQDEVHPEISTLPSPLEGVHPKDDSLLGKIELAWRDESASFVSAQLPIHLGRVTEAEFVVGDPRVSRLHARIEWRDGHFVLTDVSSYGTWVRFDGRDDVLALHRGHCQLELEGEIALGGPFDDPTVQKVRFSLAGAALALTHQASDFIP